MPISFPLVRTTAFRVVISMAVSEIVIGALMLNNTFFDFNFYFVFHALGVAAAVLTVLTIPVMLWVSLNRKGSFITMVSVEFGWTFVLWVLWFSAAIDTVTILPNSTCLLIFSSNILSLKTLDDPVLCRENQFFIVLAFIVGIILFFYNITLAFLARRLQARGQFIVWSGQILETNFFAPNPSASTVVHRAAEVVDGARARSTYPPAQGQPQVGPSNVAQSTKKSTQLPGYETQ